MTQEHSKGGHSFDEMYEKNEGIFGMPYRELKEYFKKYKPKGTLLDVGAGQGRDALYLASLGYEVTAMDTSEVGIAQMQAKAEQQDLKVCGVVADVTSISLEKEYDIILFDMLLHAFEQEQQGELVKKYARNIVKGGILCMVFPEDVERDHLLPALNTISTWKIIDEIVIRDISQTGVGKVDFTFVMVCVKKL